MKTLILIVSITFSSFVYSSDNELKDCRYRNYASYLSSGPSGSGSSRYYVMTGNHPTPSTVLSRWSSATMPNFEEPSYSQSLLQLADFMHDLEDNNHCKIKPSRCSLNGETDRFDPTVIGFPGAFNHFNASIYYSEIEKRIGVNAITTGSGTPYVRYRHYNYGSGQTSISYGNIGNSSHLDLDKMKNVLSEVKMGIEILHEKNICSNKIDRTECSFIERNLSRGWRDFWVKSDDIDVNIKILASDNKTTIEDIKKVFIDSELCL